MAKVLKCGSIVPGCTWTGRADTEEELLQKAVEHAKSAHGMSDIPPEVAAKVKAAISDG